MICQLALEDLGTGLDDDVTFDSTFTKWDLDGDGRFQRLNLVRFYKDHFSNGRDRDVVIKFMRNEDQFNNETETRNNMKTRKKMGNSSDFIIQILKSYDSTKNKEFREALSSYAGNVSLGLDNYKFALVIGKSIPQIKMKQVET